MSRERKNQTNPIFKILYIDKKHRVLHSRDFTEAKVMDFYIKWCLSPDVEEVQVLDISLSQTLCLAIYKKYKGRLMMMP